MPRRWKRAAEPEAQSPVNDAAAEEPTQTAATNQESTLAGAHIQPPTMALATNDGAHVVADPGLYAVLGLDPSVSEAAILTAYRRRAAKLLDRGLTNTQAMRELNVAYEVLGNPARREEYDRSRLSQALGPSGPTPSQPGGKTLAHVRRRTRPRHAAQPRYAGVRDVLVVLMVVGLAVLAGALIIPRLSINLSALNALQNVLPLSNSSRRVVDTAATPGSPTPGPTSTVRPGVAQRFAGSSVSVSNPNPAQYSPESVTIRLRQDGKPAANLDTWATVLYSTTEERWPATGTQKTDAAGVSTITFNIGNASPNREVKVVVFAQVDDQQPSWTTSFTPR